MKISTTSLFTLSYAAVLFEPMRSMASSDDPGKTENKPPFRIMQMGDSFSAGNGAWNPVNNERSYHSVQGCHRSKHNWGEQYADSLKDRFSVIYKNHACSGSRLEHMTNEFRVRTVSKNFFGRCPRVNYPDQEFYRSKDLFSCSHHVYPQMNFLDDSIDLVLLTIGGNDARFSTIIQKCIVPGLRSVSECKKSLDDAVGFIEGFVNELPQLLDQMNAAMKSTARVAILSYPHLVKDVDYKLADLIGGDSVDAGNIIRSLNSRARDLIGEAIDDFNKKVNKDFITYIDDSQQLFDGKEPDPRATRFNPDRWLHALSTTLVSEWYHPNPGGHGGWGEHLAKRGTFGTADGSFGDADSIASFAWAGDQDIVGKIGEEVIFDALGSYAPEGHTIVSYEWVYETDDTTSVESTTVPATGVVFDEPVDTFITLHITSSDGSTASATVRLLVNEEGSIDQSNPDDPCGLDSLGNPIWVNEDGDLLNCFVDTSALPTTDQPGIVEVSGGSGKKEKTSKSKGSKAPKKAKKTKDGNRNR